MHLSFRWSLAAIYCWIACNLSFGFLAIVAERAEIKVWKDPAANLILQPKPTIILLGILLITLAVILTQLTNFRVAPPDVPQIRRRSLFDSVVDWETLPILVKVTMVCFWINIFCSIIFLVSVALK